MKKNSPTSTVRLLIASALIAFAASALAQNSAFTYQGRLNINDALANGRYDLRFLLFDDANAGNQIGSEMLVSGTEITNGLFMVALNFGFSAFPGADRWVQIGVRTNGGVLFIPLFPRQQITAAPYAIRAATAQSAGTLSGTLPSASLTGTYSRAVNFTNDANAFRGSFSGNGALLNNVDAVTLNGLSASAFWTLRGNNGTIPGNDFIGTSDNQPLELKVNGTRALRLAPAGASPNIIGGYGENIASNGFTGVTIAGGGDINFPNRAGGHYATIAGGANNTSSGSSATVGGGLQNTSSGNGSTVSGGSQNSSAAYGSTVGGGFQNVVTANNATIPGGAYNLAAGDHSLAAGLRAKANHEGAFVWADAAGNDFASTGSNQLLLRASGGVGINTNSPGARLHVAGTVSALGRFDSTAAVGTWLTLGNSSVGGRSWSVISSGSGNGEGAGKLLFFDGSASRFELSPTGTRVAGLLELGSLRLSSGAQSGAFLTSDATGNATWSRTLSLRNDDGYAVAGYSLRGSGIFGDNNNSDTTGHAGYFNGRVRVTQSLRADNGVAGLSGTGYAISGTVSGDGTAVFGSNGGSETVGHAGYFAGRTRVTGSLTVDRTLNANGGIATGPITANSVNAGTITASGVTSTSPSGFGLAGYTTDGTAIFGDNGGSDVNGHAGYFNGKVRVTRSLVVDGDLYANVDASSLTSGVIPTPRIPNTISRSGANVGFAVTITEPNRVSTALSGKILGNLPDDNNSYGVVGDGGTFGVGVRGDSWYAAGIYARSEAGIALNAVSPQGSCIYAGPNYFDPRFIVSNLGVVTGREFRTTSDRNAKEAFAEIDPGNVLEKVASLSITTWSYKDDPAVRHIGPVAQDFSAAFQVGADDTHIATVDADGVALAAIKGLNQKLERQNRELQDRVTKLEAAVERLLKQSAGE
jgi:hypothetical protein